MDLRCAGWKFVRFCSLALTLAVAGATGSAAGQPAVPAAAPATAPASAPAAAPTPTATHCAPHARCVAVDKSGAPNPTGAYTAQCSGRFPDYIDIVPADYTGRRFKLAQTFPKHQPHHRYSWRYIDFKTPAGANRYLYAVRDYIYLGMLPADWVAQRNHHTHWVHVPWMTQGNNPREFVRGTTSERRLFGPELGIKPGVMVRNVAIGYYNDIGAFAIGRVWADPGKPAATAARFPEGTTVVKVLFSAGKPDDFSSPPGDILAGAPEWQVNLDPGKPNSIQTVRLLQMDIAVRDHRAGPTGWVYGTFAYDKDSKEHNPWRRMAPVGLMWGNDPALTKEAYDKGDRVKETLISDQIPKYAADHLGWLGRLVGPVDNPISACMSCHGTAQTPVSAPLVPPKTCTDAEKMIWFRNLAGSEAFQRLPQGACTLSPATPPPTALDYSLQVSVAFNSQSTPGNVNPCLPPAKIAAAARMLAAAPQADEYPVTRSGEPEENRPPP
jgi:hypothetical protein